MSLDEQMQPILEDAFEVARKSGDPRVVLRTLDFLNKLERKEKPKLKSKNGTQNNGDHGKGINR